MDVKLSVEEQDALDEILHHEGWKPLMKLLSVYQARIANKVLVYNLLDGTEGLVHAKARAEGAMELLTAIRATRPKPKRKGNEDA